MRSNVWRRTCTSRRPPFRNMRRSLRFRRPRWPSHEQRRRIFARRRDVLLKGLESLGLPAVQRPAGAFYAYVDISDTGLDSETFCARLIEDYGVACDARYGFRGEKRCRKATFGSHIPSTSARSKSASVASVLCCER